MHGRRFVSLSIGHARRLAARALTRRSSSIVSVRSAPEKRELTIEDETSASYRLPYAYVWEERQRQNAGVGLASEVSLRRGSDDVIDVEVSRNGSQFTVHWSSGDRTTLSADWLTKNWSWPSPASGNAAKRFHWGSDYCGENIFKFQFRRVLDDNRCLIELLSKLRSHGLVIVGGAKAERNDLIEFGKRLGRGRKRTSYGDLMMVRSTSDPSHLAYTSGTLTLHVDFPTIAYSPEIQIFHCIHQVSGSDAGSSWYCDGFAAALHLKREYPEAFRILSEYKCYNRDVGTDYMAYDSICWHPLLKLDRFGELEGIFLSNHMRGDRFSVKAKDELFHWYEAYYRFMHLLHDRERFLVRVKIQPGEMVVFDNLRVMHGRPEFKLKNDEKRHIELIYCDTDLVYANARSLAFAK